MFFDAIGSFFKGFGRAITHGSPGLAAGSSPVNALESEANLFAPAEGESAAEAAGGVVGSAVAAVGEEAAMIGE